MKTLKITTHFTTEEADCLYQLMDELKVAIWHCYGEDIVEMYKEMAAIKEKQMKENTLDDDLPF